MRTLAVTASLALLAACEGPGSTGDTTATPAAETMRGQSPSAVEEQVAAALRRHDQAWRLGRTEAEERGFAEPVEALGPPVDPNAGQTKRLRPPPGDYRCRVIKLGATGPGGPGYVESPFFGCAVELDPAGHPVLTTTGRRGTRGVLYPDTDRRLVHGRSDARRIGLRRSRPSGPALRTAMPRVAAPSRPKADPDRAPLCDPLATPRFAPAQGVAS